MAADRISLYLDLEPDQRADFEVAARAAAAFAEVVKEVAAFVDPLNDVRLDLLGSSEGSIFLNALVRLFGEDSRKSITLKAILIVCATWLGNKTLDFAWDKVTDAAWTQVTGEKKPDLSDEDLKKISQIVQGAIQSKIGERSSQRFFREVIKDKAIKGTGVSTTPAQRPIYVVPKREFAERAGLRTPSDHTISRRVRVEKEKVVLISPVLLDGRRRWKFRSFKGEFGASVRDERFLEDFLAGELPITIKQGLELTIEIETVEELRAGAWTPIDRSVLRIIGIPRKLPSDQTQLFPEDEE